MLSLILLTLKTWDLDKLNKTLDNIEEKISEYISKIDDDTSSFDDAQKTEFNLLLTLKTNLL